MCQFTDALGLIPILSALWDRPPCSKPMPRVAVAAARPRFHLEQLRNVRPNIQADIFV
jgi:hypothetical protein